MVVEIVLGIVVLTEGYVIWNLIKKTEILFDVYAKTNNYDKTIHVNRDRTADNLWRLAHPFSSLIIFVWGMNCL